jgi:dTDP-4-dehydrorhamnose 3,5-epimerase
MRLIATEIADIVIVEPDVYRDDRGFFLETYHADRYRAAGIEGPFVQDNRSRSIRGAIRGLHLQRSRPQGKLIQVVEGEVFDVAVDVRRGSPTFGRWVGVILSAGNFRQCYIAPGFAHGFCVLSDVAQVEYKCTELYDPSDELGIAWDDPRIAIAWPIAEPVLSDRDRRHPTLAAVADRLPEYHPKQAWRSAPLPNL